MLYVFIVLPFVLLIPHFTLNADASVKKDRRKHEHRLISIRLIIARGERTVGQVQCLICMAACLMLLP